MSSVGPQLPPEHQRRKRRHDESDNNDSDSTDSSTGPLPPVPQDKEQSPPSAKRTRVIGPTLPPAPLDERPPSPPQRDVESKSISEEGDDDDDEDDDDEDDGFGPSLPSANDIATTSQSLNSTSGSTPAAAAAAPAKRDEWMTLAPTSGDWSARVDPTKLKNRKFNTGRGAKGPPQAAGKGGGESWYETPEEKQARLRREVMGIQDTAANKTRGAAGSEHGAHDEATARRLKEYNVSVALRLDLCLVTGFLSRQSRRSGSSLLHRMGLNIGYLFRRYLHTPSSMPAFWLLPISLPTGHCLLED